MTTYEKGGVKISQKNPHSGGGGHTVHKVFQTKIEHVNYKILLLQKTNFDKYLAKIKVKGNISYPSDERISKVQIFLFIDSMRVQIPVDMLTKY